MSESSQELQNVKTLNVLAVGLCVLAYLFDKHVLYVVAMAVVLLSLFPAPVVNLIAGAWIGLGHVLGAINTRIILSLVYFLVLTPLGLLSQLSHDKLMRKRASRDSVYIERNHTYTANDLKYPW